MSYAPDMATRADGGRQRGGRRPGDSGTREAILTAARAAFAEHGYDRATIRGIAAEAGVDAALVHHFHGTKQQLFARAMQLPLDPDAVITELTAGGPDGIGERIARFFVGLLSDPELAGPIIAMIRSAVGNPDAARMLREFYTAVVIRGIAVRLGLPDGELRASLCGSQIIGLAVARHVLELPALVAAGDEALIAAYGDALQRYLTGPLP